MSSLCNETWPATWTPPKPSAQPHFPGTASRPLLWVTAQANRLERHPRLHSHSQLSPRFWPPHPESSLPTAHCLPPLPPWPFHPNGSWGAGEGRSAPASSSRPSRLASPRGSSFLLLTWHRHREGLTLFCPACLVSGRLSVPETEYPNLGHTAHRRPRPSQDRAPAV